MSSAIDEPQSRMHGGTEFRVRLQGLVREQPWLALGAALAAGGILGGLAFTRMGRLAFFVVAGFAAHGLRDRVNTRA